MTENDPTVSLGPDTIKKIAEAVKPYTEPRKNVKADSKGRLTGAQPETKYLRREDPDGTITYVPEVPKTFDVRMEFSVKDFKDFFGVDPSVVVVDGLRTQEVTAPGYLPHGLVLQWFHLDAEGNRIYENGSAVRGTTLYCIKEGEEA